MKIGIAITVLLFVLGATGVGLAVAQIPEFSDVVLEETRTPVPGSNVVELDRRRYNVFYEAGGTVDRSDDLPVPPLAITVRRADGDGRPLPMRDYNGSFTTSTSERESTAIRTVEVPRAGRYRIEARGHEPPSEFTEPGVALGEPIGRRVMLLIVGVVAAVLFTLSGMLVLIFTIVRRASSD